MAFTATTRQVLAELGFADPKSLHRRREDYNAKNNPVSPEQKIFQFGVHYTRQTPSHRAPILWDLEKTVRAWKAATRVLSMSSLQESAAATVRESMEAQS